MVKKKNETIFSLAKKGFPIAVKKIGIKKANKLGLIELARIGKKKK